MKLRTTAIYFLILLVIGAVYGAMRMEKQKTATKEKLARRVFTFSPDSVTQIEIESGQHKLISLKKAGKWTISTPIVSEVDNTQLTGFLSTLQNVEMERKIGKPSGDLKAFGLDKPSLVVRFLTAGKWLELDAGAKNPVGTDRYARAGKSGEIFDISSQAYDDLNKNLTALRRKELFSWKPGQVKAFQITWKNGDQVAVARQGDTGLWKSKTQPQLKISSDKVDNFLEGLHWLRAANFPPESAKPTSPDIAVNIELRGGKTAQLQAQLPGPGEKQALATSSELPWPVLLPTYFLSSLPHTVDALVDKSLLSSRPSDIKKISWKTQGTSAELARMANNHWGIVEGASPPKSIKNPWAAESLLAALHNTEYIGAASPAAAAPSGASNSLTLVDTFGKKTSLTWNAVEAKNAGPVDAWLEKDGSLSQLRINSKDILRIDSLLSSLNPVEKAAAPVKNAASAKK